MMGLLLSGECGTFWGRAKAQSLRRIPSLMYLLYTAVGNSPQALHFIAPIATPTAYYLWDFEAK